VGSEALFVFEIMKYLFVLILGLFLLPACNSTGRGTTAEQEAGSMDKGKLKKHSEQARAFCRKNCYDTLNCILVDMSVHSGNKRFVVWDFKKDTLVLAGLVSHGCGTAPWGKDHSKEDPVFSNTNDSHCSSLGKYKIGARGYSQWGIKVNYLLHGLENSNNNALKREIVLHSWEDIPDEELYPQGTPEGWGCPAVSNATLLQVDNLIRNKSRPVLLWIYQ
jgi:hypothetical protein